MSADLLFTICNNFVLPGWALLILLPRWKWTLAIICSGILPFALGLVYIAILITQFDKMGGAGFSSLQAVMALFTDPYLVTLGWVHYLAFDLFVGCWELKDSQRIGVPHWQVVPCLLLTLMFGPVGLVLYFIMRSLKTRQVLIFTD